MATMAKYLLPPQRLHRQDEGPSQADPPPASTRRRSTKDRPQASKARPRSLSPNAKKPGRRKSVLASLLGYSSPRRSSKRTSKSEEPSMRRDDLTDALSVHEIHVLLSSSMSSASSSSPSSSPASSAAALSPAPRADAEPIGCLVLKGLPEAFARLSVFAAKQTCFNCMSVAHQLATAGGVGNGGGQAPLCRAPPTTGPHGMEQPDGWVRVRLPGLEQLLTWREGALSSTSAHYKGLVTLQTAESHEDSFMDVRVAALPTLHGVLERTPDVFVFQCLQARPLSATRHPIAAPTTSPGSKQQRRDSREEAGPASSPEHSDITRYPWLDMEMDMMRTALSLRCPGVKEAILSALTEGMDLSSGRREGGGRRNNAAAAAAAAAAPAATNGGSKSSGSARDAPVACVLDLVPVHLQPPSPISASIVRSKLATDAQGQVYTQYELVVQQGNLSWTVLRRYSEFAGLHQSLQETLSLGGVVDIAVLPRLPAKKLVGNLNDGHIEHRKEILDQYIKSLLSQATALENVHVLSFLGLLSLSRVSAKPSTPPPADSVDGGRVASSQPRPIIHITRLRDAAGPGDLVLFRCNNSLSTLQRAATGAEWDHVGLVVRSPYSSSLDLLESTAEGVTVYPLMSRIRAYANGFTQYMVLRKIEGHRSRFLINQLTGFATKTDGKPYGFSITKLFPRKEVRSVANDGNSATTSRDTIADRSFTNSLENKKTFFCSELVAAAMKESGIILPTYNCSYFWPGSFAVGGEVDEAMVEGIAYGGEMLIDCRVMEVAHAHEVAPSNL
uniref:PX domain-containing protein n=1 Tax=Rhizochromulina marina TaxID=1034831 RepID=A0A7S2WHQ2_9STRA|mmetsp:Transcript_24601/g.72126  ORF Transcript_24601/g.72126 Transcript_24601/m.72126 type:complete len:786 (+) Transcript_24601:82-2439(+)